MKQLAVVLCMVLWASVCGCQYVARAYPGPELPGDQVSVIKGSNRVDIYAIDGDGKHRSAHALRKTLSGFWWFGFEVRVLPGKHELALGCSWREFRTQREMLS
jgi:hypothetical protein